MAASSVAWMAPTVDRAAARASQARAARAGRPRRSHKRAALVALERARARFPGVCCGGGVARQVRGLFNDRSRARGQVDGAAERLERRRHRAARKLEQAPHALEASQRLGLHIAASRVVDCTEPRVVSAAAPGNQGAHLCRRGPASSPQSMLGIVEVSGVPREARERRLGARLRRARGAGDKSIRECARSVAVTRAASQLGAEGVGGGA